MINNAGYEVQDTVTQLPGYAEGWTTTIVATVEATAEFTGDAGLLLSAYESFDRGWGPLPQVLLDELLDDLVEELLAEGFEHWFPDSGYVFLGALEAAAFDASSQTVEDFEGAWGAIDADNVLSPSELSTAVFDGELVEDFEEQWGNEAFTLGSVEAAQFDAGGLSTSASSPTAFEQFTLRVRQRVRSSISEDKLTATAPPLLLANGDAVTLLAEDGELPVPLVAGTTYIAQNVGSNAFKVAPYDGAYTLDITSDGSGANYVLADPGRFWLDEL